MPLFYLVTQRAEFLERWTAVLSRRGELAVADGLPSLQSLLTGADPQAVVVDRAVLGEAAPSFLVILKRLCGEANLLIGDTDYDAEAELLALAAGVAACCDAALGAEELDRILGVVLEGGLWISRQTMPVLAGRLQTLSSAKAPAAIPAKPATAEAAREAAAFEELTQRQREVAELVAQGESNKAIARRLDISDRTVKAHLTTIFDKLGFSDRLQLALYITRRNPEEETE